MFSKLRHVSNQASLAAVLSAVALVPVGAAFFAIYERYDGSLRAITYGSSSILRPAIFGSLALGMALAAVGVVLGLNTIGRRRNEHPTRAWLGFFVGSIALTLALMGAVLFKVWGLAVA